MSAPCPHNFKGASCCECPLDCACRRFALVAGKCAVGIPIAPQVGDASGIEAYSEPPAPDDNLPKACVHRDITPIPGGGARCVGCRETLFVGMAGRIDSPPAPKSPNASEPHEFEGKGGPGGGWCRVCDLRAWAPVHKTPNTPEPAPKPGVARATWSLVMADMLERDAAGAAKYGIRHQHDNGRDHLVDAYQEALDLALYLRAEIEKRKAAAQ